jgi:hypothetical protein
MSDIKSVRRRRRTLIAAMVAVVALTATAAIAAITEFEDVPDDHLFAMEIAWMHENDITRGCNPPANTLYCPENFVTRGQMAAFFYRLAHTPTLKGHFGGSTEEFYVVTETGTLGVEPTALAAECNNGDIATGGGYEAEGVTVVSINRPGLPGEPVGSPASAWTVEAVGTGDISVYATCVSQS